MNTGKSICFYIFLTPLFDNIADLNDFLKILTFRFYDRGFKNSLQIDAEDDGDDRPNTKKKLQS